MVNKLTDPSKLEFNSGTPGINKVLLADNVVLSTTPVPQFQGGIQIEDSTGTAQTLITHDGTDVLFTDTSGGAPTLSSDLPFILSLTGPLDLPGSWNQTLCLLEWQYSATGGGTGSGAIVGQKINLVWDSTDILSGASAGLTGIEIFCQANQDFNGVIGNHDLNGIDINLTGYSGTTAKDFVWRGITLDISTVGMTTTLIDGYRFNAPNCTANVAEFRGMTLRGANANTGCAMPLARSLIVAPAYTSGSGTLTDRYTIFCDVSSGGAASGINAGIWMAGAENICFRDEAIFTHSPSDGVYRITSDGSIELNSPIVSLDDSQNLEFGTGNDAAIYYDATNLVIDPAQVGSGFVDLNGGNLKADSLGLGGDDPGSVAFIECVTTSSSKLAVIYGILDYTGSSNVTGTLQATATYNGSHTGPNNYAGIFNAYIGDDNQSTYSTVATCTTQFVSGFEDNTVAMTGSGFNVFYGAQFSALPSGNVGGTHSAGTSIYAYGLVLSSISTPAGAGTFVKKGLHSNESIEVFADVPFVFDTTAFANGDTKVYYDSGDQTIKVEVDGTQSIELSDAGNMGIGGTAYSSNAIINYNAASSTVRNALAFTLDYTGSSSVAAVLVSATNNSSATSPTANALNLSLVHSVTPSGTSTVSTADVTTVLDSMAFTDGTHHVSGVLLDFTDNSASNSGGTFYRKPIKVPSWGSLTGVTGDTVWCDFGTQIGLRDDVNLCFGGSNTSVNTTNKMYYDSGNSWIQADGDFNFADEVHGTRQTWGGGDNTSSSSSRYLKGYNGQLYTATLGYYCLRAGSITGVGTTFTYSLGLSGATVTIQVRKNGTSVFTTGAISTVAAADTKGGNTQARGTDTFAAGDVLQLYLSISGSVTVEDIQAWCEIIYDDS